MKRVELFAYPAWHSLSPAMHNAAFESLGIDARYTSREVPPAGLEGAVESLRDGDSLGANVTIPHKEAVLPLLDHVSGEASAVGAVNTIVRRGDVLEGHNTDIPGFLQALAETGVDIQDRRAVLLGAGGSARAVAYALLMAGVGELLIHNRTFERAEGLASDFARLGEVRAIGVEELEVAGPEAVLLVNATSVGMMRQGVSFDDSPVDPRCLPRAGAVVDLVYRPARTRLLRDAEAAGLSAQNGLPMLVYQGAGAFTMWTGMAAPVDVMRAAVERALSS